MLSPSDMFQISTDAPKNLLGILLKQLTMQNCKRYRMQEEKRFYFIFGWWNKGRGNSEDNVTDWWIMMSVVRMQVDDAINRSAISDSYEKCMTENDILYDHIAVGEKQNDTSELHEIEVRNLWLMTKEYGPQQAHYLYGNFKTVVHLQ